jgi:choline dehydrogenase-like flavoprotein
MMHFDLDERGPCEVSGEVCIVGAGVAGITAARRLLAAGRTVVLLESGGLDHEAGTADLNAGDNAGEHYYELDHARLRLFGGTTAIWGGRCAQLDPIDFEKRSWIPHSGWPIGAAELVPYYREARQVFGLPPDAPAAERLRDRLALPAFDPDRINIALWSFDGLSDRFTFYRCQDLVNHPRCTVVTHATVTDILAVPSAQAVTGLTARGLSGATMTLRAGTCILAAGGIENARLLLAARGTMPMGLGNAYDQVGRYFMEHPHARGGRIRSPMAWRLLAAFAARHRLGAEHVSPLVTPGPALQRRAGLLNTSLTIAPRPPAEGRQHWGMRLYMRAKHDFAPNRRGRTAWNGLKKAVRGVQAVSDPLRPWVLHKMGKLELALLVRAEQAPNPDSRITLSDQRDAMGLERTRLDWRLSALDVDSVAGLVQALDSEARRLNLGAVEAADWLTHPARRWKTDPLVSIHPIGGYHHMGTTRMSSDPRHGVTDARARVHGIDNLYVAGSSLFSTSGWANPTLTIAALSLRIADDIVAAGAVVAARGMAAAEAA